MMRSYFVILTQIILPIRHPIDCATHKYTTHKFSFSGIRKVQWNNLRAIAIYQVCYGINFGRVIQQN